MAKTVKERFDEKCEAVTESGCWVWLGCLLLGQILAARPPIVRRCVLIKCVDLMLCQSAACLIQ